MCFFSARWRERDGGLQHGAQKRHHRRVCGGRGAADAHAVPGARDRSAAVRGGAARLRQPVGPAAGLAGVRGPEGGGSIGMYGGVRGGGRAARALRCGGGRRFDMCPNHRLRHVLFQRPLARAGRRIAARGTKAASSACMRRARGRTRRAGFALRRRSAGPPPLLWPYPYHLFPRIVRPLCRFQRYSCPARPNPARRRHPARASAFPAQPYPCAPPASTVQSYPCLPPVFSCAPPPASPCGLSLRAAGSARLQFLPALRGKGGYWQGYSARPSASSARPNPARRGFCPPRHPARRRPRHPHSPIPPCRGFCPSAAGKADIGREPARAVPAASPCAPPAAGFCPSAAGRADIGSEPARTVPAASPCAPARVLRAALSLRAAGFARLQFCLRSAGRADIGIEPARACAPRRPAPARPRSPCGLTQRAAGSVRRVALRPPARVPRAA